MSNAIATRLKEIQGRGLQHRVAAVARNGIDADARTVELAFSSETDTVERFFGIEILGHGAAEVDLSRLENGAPLLWGHDQNDQRGIVEAAWISADRVGRARVRFSKSPEGEKLLQDVRDGIVTKVSVGYWVDDLVHAGERDGIPIYRAIWTPYEISLVSIPADDTVGVGRSAQSLTLEETRAWQQLAATRNKLDEPKPMNDFAEFLRTAGQGQTPVISYDGDGNVRHVFERKAVSVQHRSMRELELPAFVPSDLRDAHIPTGTDCSKRTKMSHAVLAGSRVVAAGAHPIIASAAAGPATVNNGVTVYPRRETHFDCIEPAQFAFVIDGDNVTESAPPIFRSCVDLDDGMKTYGFRVKLTRSERKSYQQGELEDATLTSIALGISRIVDQVALKMILLKEPTAFSVAKAAALGITWAELRGLIGTNGAGAVVDVNGALRLTPTNVFNTGVIAEMTPVMAPSIIGAWNRMAVAVFEDITMIAERIDGHGGVTLTCFVNIEALVPMPGAFWTAGA